MYLSLKNESVAYYQEYMKLVFRFREKTLGIYFDFSPKNKYETIIYLEEESCVDGEGRNNSLLKHVVNKSNDIVGYVSLEGSSVSQVEKELAVAIIDNYQEFQFEYSEGICAKVIIPNFIITMAEECFLNFHQA